MMDHGQKEYRFQGLLRTMGVLTILGMLSAIVFLLKYSPITLALFMMVGQLFIVASVILYIYVVIKDLKERKVL